MPLKSISRLVAGSSSPPPTRRARTRRPVATDGALVSAIDAHHERVCIIELAVLRAALAFQASGRLHDSLSCLADQSCRLAYADVLSFHSVFIPVAVDCGGTLEKF